MKHKNYLLLIILFCQINFSSAQQNINPVSPELYEIQDKTEIIKQIINDPVNASKRVEYPLQNNYFKPYLQSQAKSNTLTTDITPPSDPSNFIVTTSSIFSVGVSFTPSVDPESGISYYAFAIGTAPGLSNIRYWQSLGTNTYAGSFSLKN